MSKSLTTAVTEGSAPGLSQSISTFARTMAFLAPRSTEPAGHTGPNTGLLLACILIPVCALLLAGLGFLWWRKHALYRRDGKHAKVDNGTRSSSSLPRLTLTLASTRYRPAHAHEVAAHFDDDDLVVAAERAAAGVLARGRCGPVCGALRAVAPAVAVAARVLEGRVEPEEGCVQ